jgi:hypothetical protein
MMSVWLREVREFERNTCGSAVIADVANADIVVSKIPA